MVLFLVLSSRVQEEGGGEKIIPIAVEAAAVGSKPPAVVVVRISPGERHTFGASMLRCLHWPEHHPCKGELEVQL